MSEHIVLRRIRSDADIEKVREIFPKIFPEEKNRIDDCIGAFEESINGKPIDDCNVLDYYFVCRDDGTVLGMTGMYSNNPKEVWLGWFGVLPEYRRQGIGRHTLLATMNIMMDMGYWCIRLYTDPKADKDAIRLYEQVGFVKDSEYDEKTITMKKRVHFLLYGTESEWFDDWKGKPFGM